jgi:hypothetical protein
MSIVVGTLSFYPFPELNAHFEHFTHYNNGGDKLGKYYVYEAVQPQYASPGEPSTIMFSIQDTDRNDLKAVNVLIEIYSGVTGERIKVYPWTVYSTGDFEVGYIFPQSGPYQLVLSLSNLESFKSENNFLIDPPRTILSSTSDCSCDRAVFNISISESFGPIYNSTLLIAVLIPISILGTILVLNYRRKKLQIDGHSNLTKNEIMKYSIMLLAISAGLVHLAIYSEHASLRIEYSIFLIVAGASQVVYGIMYILLTLRYQAEYRLQKPYYEKTVILNLFGLIGSLILIGLYTYTLVFPPPISPNDKPEGIEPAGVLAKSSEILLVIGIAYIIRTDKKRFRSHAIAVS